MTRHTAHCDGGLVPNTNRNDRHHDHHPFARHRRLPHPPSHPGPSATRTAIYVIAGLGWLGPLLDQTFGHGHGEVPGQLIWILLPVGAATVLRWKAGDGFADAGLRPLHRRNRAWYLLSSSFYPVVMIAATAGGVAVGDSETYDDWAPLRFAAIALVALVPFTFTAIAEEFGWRGFVALTTAHYNSYTRSYDNTSADSLQRRRAFPHR